jgi:hypothetical protein
MHTGDKISWDVLGEESEWKVSDGKPDRKETNISKRITDHKERGCNVISATWLHIRGCIKNIPYW